MSQPKAIFIQLTTACNARCINCPHHFTYGKKGYHTNGVMPDAIWEKILDDIIKNEYNEQVGLYLHHEPLLDMSLYRKIDDINSKTKAYIVLSTNGSLLNEANRKNLIHSRPRQIHININQADKIQYEQMTGLDYERTISNTRAFIDEARGLINVEINCPVLPEVDTEKLKSIFPDVHVNDAFWANSRGGLLPEINSANKGSRFKLSECCLQPTINFNILWDGSVVACCIDWSHETKASFKNVMQEYIFSIYNGNVMKKLQAEFINGDYTRYKMCQHCAKEMGFIS